MCYICRDLNPLHDVINKKDYKEKYYTKLIPLGLKYAEVSGILNSIIVNIKIELKFVLGVVKFKEPFMQLLPWGGMITSESLRFFSPIVIWTKFSSSQDNYNLLYSAFMEYYKVIHSFHLHKCTCSFCLYVLHKSFLGDLKYRALLSIKYSHRLKLCGYQLILARDNKFLILYIWTLSYKLCYGSSANITIGMSTH